MPAGLKALSRGERDTLLVLWEHGPSNVRQVLVVLRSRGREWAYTTVKTVLDRLEKKGYAQRQPTSGAHIYSPTVTREVLAQQRVAELRETLFAGSATPLVRALVSGGLDTAEIAELRALLDELDSGNDS